MFFYVSKNIDLLQYPENLNVLLCKSKNRNKSRLGRSVRWFTLGKKNNHGSWYNVIHERQDFGESGKYYTV